MEADKYQRFLNECGLKTKIIAERLRTSVRAIQKYKNDGKIHPSLCRLIELEFSEYDIETAQKISHSGDDTTPKDITNKKNQEIARLEEKVKTLQELKDMQARNIELLEDKLKRYESLKNTNKTPDKAG